MASASPIISMTKLMEDDDPHQVARLLLNIFERTSNPVFQRAAHVLLSEPPGRPAIDDTVALTEALALIETGQAKSPRAAFMAVAKSISGPKHARSTAERLRRKAQRQKEFCHILFRGIGGA